MKAQILSILVLLGLIAYFCSFSNDRTKSEIYSGLSINNLKLGMHKSQIGMKNLQQFQRYTAWTDSDGGTLKFFCDDSGYLNRISAYSIDGDEYKDSRVVRLCFMGRTRLSFGADLAEAQAFLGAPDYFLQADENETEAVYLRWNLMIAVVKKRIVSFVLDSDPKRLGIESHRAGRSKSHL